MYGVCKYSTKVLSDFISNSRRFRGNLRALALFSSKNLSQYSEVLKNKGYLNPNLLLLKTVHGFIKVKLAGDFIKTVIYCI